MYVYITVRIPANSSLQLFSSVMLWLSIMDATMCCYTSRYLKEQMLQHAPQIHTFSRYKYDVLYVCLKLFQILAK